MTIFASAIWAFIDWSYHVQFREMSKSELRGGRRGAARLSQIAIAALSSLNRSYDEGQVTQSYRTEPFSPE